MEGVQRGTRTTEAAVDLVRGCFRVAFPVSDIALICKDLRVPPLRSCLEPFGLWVRNSGEGELLKTAVSGGKNEFPCKGGNGWPLTPQKLQSGRTDLFALMTQVKQVSAFSHETPSQIANPCQGLLLPSLISKKQVWKAKLGT